MKYLGLAYFTPEKFAAMAPEDVKALVSQCPALDEKMRATGKVLVSASLGDLDSWKTLRPRNGKTHVSDGPYTESKEVVGGLFIIEADKRYPFPRPGFCFGLLCGSCGPPSPGSLRPFSFGCSCSSA